jgi:anti-anti-sigma factor
MEYKIETLGKFKVISVTGNIDTDAGTKVLDDEISRCADEGNHHFVFDLKATDYLDSAGISVFIHCLCDANERGGSVFIVAGDNQARKVLEMMGLTRMIKTYDTVEDFAKDQGVEA